jgi:pimeloyl-ACP methyl ester carboxylesterase
MTLSRRQVLRNSIAASAAALGPAASRSGHAAAAPSETILVAHGAWSAGWVWKKMHPLMNAAGIRLVAPTYTGLGERVHLATRDVDLDTHVLDLANVVQFENLEEFVLLGHSYGGMVATRLADRIPDRITKLVYLDAFVPQDGQSLLDLLGPEAAKSVRERVLAGDGWRAPPNPTPPDTSAADAAWINERRMPQPVKCFETRVRLTRGDTKIPRTYIRCMRTFGNESFAGFAARAKREGWPYHEMDASHSPHVTAPDALAALLTSIVRGA